MQVKKKLLKKQLKYVCTTFIIVSDLEALSSAYDELDSHSSDQLICLSHQVNEL